MWMCLASGVFRRYTKLSPRATAESLSSPADFEGMLAVNDEIANAGKLDMMVLAHLIVEIRLSLDALVNTWNQLAHLRRLRSRSRQHLQHA